MHLKIEQFIKWKTSPQKLPNKNVEEEWFICRKNILEVSKYFFSKFLGKRIENVNEFSRVILKMRGRFYGPYLRDMIKQKIGVDMGFLNVILLPFVSLILNYKYYQRLKVLGIRNRAVLFGNPSDLVIFSSLIYLISSIDEWGVDENLLRKSQSLLKAVYPSSSKDWENISLDYANAYIAFFMQKL